MRTSLSTGTSSMNDAAWTPSVSALSNGDAITTAAVPTSTVDAGRPKTPTVARREFASVRASALSATASVKRPRTPTAANPRCVARTAAALPEADPVWRSDPPPAETASHASAVVHARLPTASVCLVAIRTAAIPPCASRRAGVCSRKAFTPLAEPPVRRAQNVSGEEGVRATHRAAG